MKDKFCSYCGSDFGTNAYPKTCRTCNNITWKNPIPIVVAVITCFIGCNGDGCTEYKVLIIQRAQDPDKGGWAFAGGFMEMGETVVQATAREVKEEIGLDIKDWYLYDTALSSTGNLLLFMHTTIDIEQAEGLVKTFEPNSEVLAVRLISKSEELTFPTHTEVLKKVFFPFEQGMI